jgi:hypothetical protein
MHICPNPSSGRFTIHFHATGAGDASIRLFDILGRTLATLWQGYINEGVNKIQLSTVQDLTGVLFIEIEADKVRTTAKVVLD